jgi:hypothetical protein
LISFGRYLGQLGTARSENEELVCARAFGEETLTGGFMSEMRKIENARKGDRAHALEQWTLGKLVADIRNLRSARHWSDIPILPYVTCSDINMGERRREATTALYRIEEQYRGDDERARDHCADDEKADDFERTPVSRLLGISQDLRHEVRR